VKASVRVALVTAGLLLIGSAGCGIPDQTGVRVDGAGQLPGADSGSGVGREPPKRIDSPDDADRFVRNFLLAPAGEASTADDRVREFLSPADRKLLPDKNDYPINVVRLVEDAKELPVTRNEDGTSRVDVAVQQIGVLQPNGELQPPQLTETSYTFRVGALDTGDGNREEAGGLYLYEPPEVLLMSVDALRSYYQQQTIYFWSREENARLVPDLRYLPGSLPPGLRPTEVLRWLTGAPASWLRDSVSDLQGTKMIGNAADNGGRLVVNLAAPELPEFRLNRLTTQLAWSLREIYPSGRLELMIRDRSVRIFDVAAQREQNPLYPVAVERQVGAYCLLSGMIRQVVAQGEQPTEPLPIAAARNRDLEFAALARDNGTVLAALVTTTGDLVVGSGNPAATDFSPSRDPVGRQARPVWLRGFDPPVGLVVAGGRMHRFDLDAQLRPLDLRGAPGTVTAVSAAEDGRRIAFIAGGRLFVAALNPTTRDVARGVRPVPVSVRQPTAVAWISETDLVVAGKNRDGHTALVDVTGGLVDMTGGTEQTLQPPREDLGFGVTVDYLAAYPFNPVRGGGPLVAYQANGAVWSGDPPTRIGVSQLHGTDPATARARPTAPFFLY
jgi:hypothetical protein